MRGSARVHVLRMARVGMMALAATLGAAGTAAAFGPAPAPPPANTPPAAPAPSVPMFGVAPGRPAPAPTTDQKSHHHCPKSSTHGATKWQAPSAVSTRPPLAR